MKVLRKFISIVLISVVCGSMGVITANATKAFVSGNISNPGDYYAISDRASKLNVTISDGNKTFGASNVYKNNSRDGTVVKNSNLTIKATASVTFDKSIDSNFLVKNDLVDYHFVASSRVYTATSKDFKTSVNDDNTTPRGTKGSSKKSDEMISVSTRNKVWDTRTVKIGNESTYYICYEAILAKHPQNPCRYYFTLDTAEDKKEQEQKTKVIVNNKSFVQGYEGKSEAEGTLDEEVKVLVYCQANVATTVYYRVFYTKYKEDGGADGNDILVATETNAIPSGDGYLKTYGFTFPSAGRYAVRVLMQGATGGAPQEVTLFINVKDREQGENGEYSMSFTDQQRIDDINKERHSEMNNGLWSGLYVFFAICGILVLIYSLLLLIAFYIDILNSFTSVSLLNKITFGSMYPVANKDESVSVDSKTVHIVSHKEIWISFALGVMASAIMLNAKGFILFIYQMFKWISNLF